MIPVDPIFEHRLYLPLVGFVVIAVDLLRRLPARTGLAAAGATLLLLSVLTVRRNALWRDPVAFWEDNLRRVPASVGVRVSLAKELADREFPDRAVTLLSEAAALAPGSEAIHNNLGNAYLKKGMLVEARSSLERALAANPHSARSLYLLGVILSETGDHAAEVEAMERAVTADPANARYLAGLGLAHQRGGNLVEAEDAQRRAIGIDPAYAKAHLDLGVTLYRKGNARAALDEFAAALRLDPDDLTTLSNYASVALELGETGLADPVLRTIRSRDVRAYQELTGKTR